MTQSFVSYKPPELFESTHDIESWLLRLSQYFEATNVMSTRQRAEQMAAGLSNEVQTALHGLYLPLTMWQNPDALADVLIKQLC